MKWTDGRMRKKLGMLAANMRVSAVNVRQDGNCEDTEAKTDDSIVNTVRLVKLNRC
jgi:hypothetical protein